MRIPPLVDQAATIIGIACDGAAGIERADGLADQLVDRDRTPLAERIDQRRRRAGCALELQVNQPGLLRQLRQHCSLVPRFERQCQCKVKTIAVGSGQAMTMGRKGEADVLLVHVPDSERRFMEAGHGVSRKDIRHNTGQPQELVQGGHLSGEPTL